MAVDASDRPNDSFGYSVYAVVALAPPEQAAAVETLRREIGMKRASMPAEITVKGTFCDIGSLDALLELVTGIAGRTAAVQVDFEDGDTLHFGESFGVVQVRLSPPLATLTTLLEGAIGPVSTNAYMGDPFWTHLTLCQDCSSEQLRRAKRLAASLALGTGFVADAIDLMGRVGPAYGGRWESIERFSLIG